MESDSMALLVLSAMVMAPLILVLVYNHWERGWEHAERMKALELGRPIGAGRPARPWWACVLVGAGVPLFLCFLATSIRSGNQIWEITAAVSLLATVPSTLVAFRVLGNSDRPAVSGHVNGKPALDPDAFDTVGRRG